MAEKKTNGKTTTTGGDLGFEADLFKAADKLRGNMEPLNDKHVALGLSYPKRRSGDIRRRDAERVVEAMR